MWSTVWTRLVLKGNSCQRLQTCYVTCVQTDSTNYIHFCSKSIKRISHHFALSFTHQKSITGTVVSHFSGCCSFKTLHLWIQVVHRFPRYTTAPLLKPESSQCPRCVAATPFMTSLSSSELSRHPYPSDSVSSPDWTKLVFPNLWLIFGPTSCF